MAKRVSAGTITGITSSSEFHDASKRPPAPDRDTLIQQIRQSIVDRIHRAEKHQDANADSRKAKETIDRAKSELAGFDKMLKSVPEGFELVPVLYSKIPQEVNASIQSEYLFSVRPRFLRHIAEKHADELKALGVSDKGIDRMLRGLDPTDEKGNYYTISIDHIVERSGSGNWSTKKLADPEQEPGMMPKYPVNHFGNLIFLPDQIHQYKNKLNELQDTGELKPGDAKWILMMAPIADATRSGYVCPPQKPDSPLFGLRLNPDNTQTRIRRAVSAVDQIQEALESFRQLPPVTRMLNLCDHEAWRSKTTVQKIANDNNIVKGTTLRKAFNDAVKKDARATAESEKFVKPAAAEAKEALVVAFNSCIANISTEKGWNEMRGFANFFEGNRMAQFRQNVAMFPTEELTDLAQVVSDLEKKMTPFLEKARAERKQQEQSREQNDPKPQNNRKPPNHGSKRR